MKLSENEKKVFEYIKQSIEDGYAPSVREICAEFGYKSTSTAHRYINSLRDKGLLEKGENRNRAIKVVASRSTMVPLVGTVTAGVPITAIEEITDYISFVPNKRYSNQLFALKVRGDSMINAAILDGDVVIVRKQEDADDGQIVIALVNGNDAVCKRLRKYKDGIALVSNNPTYEPMYFSANDTQDIPVRIIGRVVEIRAKM